jgi:hypothetical protein
VSKTIIFDRLFPRFSASGRARGGGSSNVRHRVEEFVIGIVASFATANVLVTFGERDARLRDELRLGVGNKAGLADRLVTPVFDFLQTSYMGCSAWCADGGRYHACPVP